MSLHKLQDDLQALLTGTLLAAFGIVMFKAGGLLSGGTVGIALLLNYATGLDLAVSLMIANAPFYALACWRMGREFTIKTLLCVVLAAAFVHYLPYEVSFAHLSPWAAAVMGGLMTGVGILVLFRHTSSLGGLNVLVLYLQRRWGLSPGIVQLALDSTILVGGCALLGDFSRVPASILAVIVLNLVLAFNHRPGRYAAGGHASGA
jgi:uncharacterized membrane-anchored protein YitT (DUF2179 family)